MPHEIAEALDGLTRIFHSEADFQHALAWYLHERFPDGRVQLEKRFPGEEFPGSTNDIYVDIIFEHNGTTIPIELKYKSSDFDGVWGSESFDLREHSAQDHGRYDFVADIERIETLLSLRGWACGAVVLLTNDHLYWTPPNREDVIDCDFRIHESKKLDGSLNWASHAKESTIGKKRNRTIALTGSYDLDWREFDYDIPDALKGKTDFKYLLVTVER